VTKNNDTELLRGGVIGMSTLFKSFNENLLEGKAGNSVYI